MGNLLGGGTLAGGVGQRARLSRKPRRTMRREEAGAVSPWSRGSQYRAAPTTTGALTGAPRRRPTAVNQESNAISNNSCRRIKGKISLIRQLWRAGDVANDSSRNVPFHEVAAWIRARAGRRAPPW